LFPTEDVVMAFDSVQAHVRDLGTFTVKRLLPAATHRMVGPFVFFDHMGPATMAIGRGMDVRPHPHIGLATVTYLFEGSGLHRDSLGTVQIIRPGDVNWMVAGRGVVHSERTPLEDLAHERILHGIQIWVALPEAHEQDPASFSHHPAASLPQLEVDGVQLRVILGTAFGATAPTPVLSPSFYVHAKLPAGAILTLPADYPGRAVYAVDTDLGIGGDTLVAHHMAVLEPGKPVSITSAADASVILLGGAVLTGERHLNWNFVASSRELIAAARASWLSYPNEQFPQVPDETEWIPLP
jgi:redox-sensitive bicupin YhaK (pirin superfamily)